MNALRHRILTRRQESILIATAEGARCEQIAQGMRISLALVQAERLAICRKLGTANSFEAVAVAYEIGLLPGLTDIRRESDPFIHRLRKERKDR